MPLYEGFGLISEKLPIVLEIGQALTKAGFAGENSPRCIIPSNLHKKAGSTKELVNLFEICDVDSLYETLVEFLNLIYSKYLLVTPKDRKVVIVESIFSPTRWRTTLAKVLYIHFEVLSILWIPTHLCAVCSTGYDSALVLDIGKEEASVVPIVNGVTLLSNIASHQLGSNTFDANLKELLLENCLNPNEDLKNLLNMSIVEDIRVRSSLVSTFLRLQYLKTSEHLDPQLKPFKIEINGSSFYEFKGIIRELASEIWFQTKDLDGISLPNMILDVLSKCPIDCRRLLSKSILICGGTAMIPGFKYRLLEELKRLISEGQYRDKFNSTYEFRIFNLPIEENCAAWFGASVYGSSEAMGLRGISKEYFLKTGILPDWSNPAATSNYLNIGMVNATFTTPSNSPISKLS